jgi:hypothetical protein
MGRSGQRPAAVLIDVVHLWAIHLSGSERSPSQPHQDSAGLGRRSPRGHSTGFPTRGSSRDAMEECERISGLWAALALPACFTTADGSPGRISYTTSASRIDTPW